MKLITKKTEVITDNLVDINTAELVEQSIITKAHQIIVDDEPAFAMLYMTIIGAIDGLDRLSLKVLIWSMLKCEYNTNTVNLSKPMCALITKEYNLTYGSIKNAISKLKQQGILISLGSGTYRLNPRYSWKGTSADRKKTMKYVLTVECPEC